MTESHTTDGFTITSTSATSEQLAEQFKPSDKPETPETAPETVQADPVTSVTSEPGEGKEAAPAPAEKPLGKPKNDPRARVEQATRQAAEAKRQRDEIERRAVAAEQELERLRAGLPKESKPEPAKVETKAPDGKPKADDFETYDEYVEALTDWKAEQRDKTVKESAHREALLSHQQSLFNSFQERIQKAIEADPTIDEKIHPDIVAMVPNGPVDFSKRMSNDDLIGVHFIAEEKGLDMMRHLSEYPDVLQRLRGLSQPQLLVELGRIDARLGSVTTAPDPKPISISRANPPVRPVTAVAPSGDDPMTLPDASLSAVEWGRRREALEERRRKANR